MRRAIRGFHRDPEGDWVADLDCGHGQHVRHRPPFLERAWVLEETGRRSRVGTELECPLCDRALEAGDAACHLEDVCDGCGGLGAHRAGCTMG